MTDVSLISDADFESINKRSKVGVGDIIFGMIGTIGNPVIVDRDDFAIKNVALIKCGGEVPNDFLLQLLKSHIFESYIRIENAGNTQKFLGLGKIRDYLFNTPHAEEMEHIGTFFRTLDNTIATQKRKLNALKQLKKAYLQQMFPQVGETTPKVRLGGFSEPWEIRRLGDCFDYASSKHTASNFPQVVGGYPLFDANKQIGEISSFDQEHPYISIIKDGAGVGRITKRNARTSVIATMGYLLPSCDLEFGFAYLQTLNFNGFITGTTIPHIYYKDYSQKAMFVPTPNEQAAIGDFFRTLSENFVNQKAKLNSLTQLKTAYLQKMFV